MEPSQPRAFWKNGFIFNFFYDTNFIQIIYPSEISVLIYDFSEKLSISSRILSLFAQQ